jgi:hypothetical protein
MKSRELSLVLSAHRDWHESTSHPGAGPSHEQQPHSGRSDENHFVSAATECDLSAEDIAFMESVIKEDDDNVCIDCLMYIMSGATLNWLLYIQCLTKKNIACQINYCPQFLFFNCQNDPSRIHHVRRSNFHWYFYPPPPPPPPPISIQYCTWSYLTIDFPIKATTFQSMKMKSCQSKAI